MVEIISDKRKIEVVDDSVVITREVAEKYSTQEYISECEKLNMHINLTKEKVEEFEKVRMQFDEKLKDVQELDAVVKAKHKAEREEAVKKFDKDHKLNEFA